MMRPVAVLVVSDVFVNLPSSCPSQKILYCFQKRENEFRFETLQNIFKMSIQAVDSWQVIIVCLCCGDDWAIHNNGFHLNQTKQTLAGIPLFHSYPHSCIWEDQCSPCLSFLLHISKVFVYCWRCSFEFVQMFCIAGAALIILFAERPRVSVRKWKIRGFGDISSEKKLVSLPSRRSRRIKAEQQQCFNWKTKT